MIKVLRSMVGKPSNPRSRLGIPASYNEHGTERDQVHGARIVPPSSWLPAMRRADEIKNAIAVGEADRPRRAE